MAYPTGIKIYIDGEDATWYIFGVNTFNPSSGNNVFKNINITPYLRHASTANPSTMHPDEGTTDEHTIVITAADGNGRVECRVEVR